MLRYLARRLMWMIPTLFGITLACFLLLRFAGGDPVRAQLDNLRGQQISQEECAVNPQSIQGSCKLLLEFPSWYSERV